MVQSTSHDNLHRCYDIMEPLKKAFTHIRRYTFTQLLLFSALLLVVSTPLFGIVFSVAVVTCYLVTNAAWNVNLESLANVIAVATFHRARSERDYTDAQREVDRIKCLISKSFVLSWTSELNLCQTTELSVVEATYILIDELLSLLSAKQVNIYSAVTDLIKGAHLHILKYNIAKIEPLRRIHTKIPETKTSTKARFLELSLSEWHQAHQDEQTDFPRKVTERILRKFLPTKEPSPIALEALTAIISENVLLELLQYLSQQENLLKLVIRVLSDDFEALLKTAEIGSLTVSDKNTEDRIEQADNVLALDLQGVNEYENGDRHESDAETDKSECLDCKTEISENTILADSESNEGLEGKAEPLHSGDEYVSADLMMESKAEPLHSGDEYVSADLMKYLRVVPSASAVKTAPTTLQKPTKTDPSTLISAVPALTSHSNLPLHDANSEPKCLPMISMAPAMSIASTVNNSEMVANKALPMSTITPALKVACSPEIAGTRPKVVPMMAMTPAIYDDNQSAAANSRRGSLGYAKSLDSQSIDSGLSNEIKDESLESDTTRPIADPLPNLEGKKFLSIGIPTTEIHVEKQSHVKYTLYVISYRAAYLSEPPDKGQSIRECTIYRRYREFMNLRARLEKCSQYNKALRSISGPSWWRQLSLGTLKPKEIERRRKQLEKFLQQLVAQPIINESKDLEEFLAYYGNADIEFVQEKVVYIPQAVRLDKVVIRTVTGMVDKVTGKLTSQSHGGSPDGRRFSEAANQKKSKQGDVADKADARSPVFSLHDTIESNLLELKDKLKRKDFRPKSTEARRLATDQRDENYHCQKLADSLFQIVLLLLQSHADLSKNTKVVSAASVVLVPYLTRWLRNKIGHYSTPSEVSSLLVLFRETLWPENEEIHKQYDIDILKTLARQCVLQEIPAPVAALMESEINRIFSDILVMTEISAVNEQLGYCLLDQLLQNSLEVLVKDMTKPKQ